MTWRNADGLVRLGMLALPLAGLLALVGLYSTLKLGAGGILATGDNRAIVSTGFFASVFLGNVLALTVLIFGVVALHAFLANSGEKLLATHDTEHRRDCPDAIAPWRHRLRRSGSQPVVPERQP